MYRSNVQWFSQRGSMLQHQFQETKCRASGYSILQVHLSLVQGPSQNACFSGILLNWRSHPIATCLRQTTFVFTCITEFLFEIFHYLWSGSSENAPSRPIRITSEGIDQRSTIWLSIWLPLLDTEEGIKEQQRPCCNNEPVRIHSMV